MFTTTPSLPAPIRRHPASPGRPSAPHSQPSTLTSTCIRRGTPPSDIGPAVRADSRVRPQPAPARCFQVNIRLKPPWLAGESPASRPCSLRLPSGQRPRRGPHCRSSNPGVRCDVARHIVFSAGRPVRGRARRPAGPHPPSERPTSPIGGCRSHVLRYDRGSLRRRGPACARRGRTACFLRREFLRSDGCRSAGLVSRRRRFLGGAARGRGPRIPAAADASLLSLSGQVTRATTPGSTRPSLKRIRRPLGRPPPRGSASRLRVSADRPPEHVWVREGVTGSPGGPPGCSPSPRRLPPENYQRAHPPPTHPPTDLENVSGIASIAARIGALFKEVAQIAPCHPASAVLGQHRRGRLAC